MTELTKRKLIWPAIVLSCAPILFIIPFPSTATPSSVAMYLSALAGYVGTMFLLWTYVLGAKSVIGIVFDDLAPILKVHKNLGMWGSLAFLLHPLLVAYGYFELTVKAALYILSPDISTAFERHVTLGRFAFLVILVVWLTSKVVRKRIGFRAWKYIHYFSYIALPFVLLHIPDIGSAYATHPLVRIYYFAIICLFALFTLFRIPGWLNLDRKKYVITEHTKITDEDYMMVVKPLQKKWLAPKPGQYIYLKVGFVSEDHPFTVAYYDKNTGMMWLDYRVFGAFTKYIATLKSGHVVNLAGPYGSFMGNMTKDTSVLNVYIAGGIGITPFLQRIRDEATSRPQLLFAANKTYQTAVMVPQVKSILGNRCIAIYSREATVAPGDEKGHIDEKLLRHYLPDPQKYHYYLCGPESFVHTITNILHHSMHVQKEYIHTEDFSW